MIEGYIDLNGVPTHLITWGKWVENGFLPHEREVIICITGNPGQPGFYVPFLTTLHNESEIPVWVIGHAGHDDPPDNSVRKVPDLLGNEDKFDLAGQILHKIDLIQKYVPDHVKIHLFGHSIGSWMILELLKHPEIKRKVHHAYLLFPTVERMAESVNGVRLINYVSPFMFLLRGLALFLAMMPYSLQVFFVYIYYWCVGMPSSFLGTSLKFVKPTALDKVHFLAMDEMAKVRELDVATVVDNQDILTLYYGTTDGWVPVSYYEDMKRRVPGVRAELCKKQLPHAFVLKHGPEMAHICGNWIAKNRANR